MKECCIGQLTLGTTPRIVGTLSSRESLPSAHGTGNYTCDVVEVRLDQIGSNTHGWMNDCQAIQSAGYPVILTLRLANEGGKWTDKDEGRRHILTSAIDNLACIDVELASSLRQDLCHHAAKLGKHIIVSSHNFNQTPCFEELKTVLDSILDIPNAIPKISTMVNNDSDVDTLMRLLNAARPRPVCIIGMGSEGTKTRVMFPAMGASLAYGYLDSPSAPGQLPSSVLTQYLRQLLPKYNQDVIIRKEIMDFA